MDFIPMVRRLLADHRTLPNKYFPATWKIVRPARDALLYDVRKQDRPWIAV
jgi:hypothetical protein